MLEAFANVYCDGFDDMVRHASGQNVQLRKTIYPNVSDGVEGVRFVQQCVDSHRDRGRWITS
jgi:hypothetical protein